MKFEVLVSCMYEDPLSLYERSSLDSDCLIVNQCDEDSENIYFVKKEKIRAINSTQRGLSKSRNMAIQNSNSDICLIADDDHKFVPNLADEIKKVFINNPQADIIIFNINKKGKKRISHTKKLRLLDLLKVTSTQIAFRRKAIIENRISFDELMGSGSGNGPGEENKFLFDAYKSGLRIIQHPLLTASIVESKKSQWFSGYNRKYFFDRGWATRRILGFFAIPYFIYFMLFKYNLYKRDINPFNAICAFWKGFNKQI